MKTSGIYKIINKVNGKYYVGSSENILCKKTGRFIRHKKDLKNNSHHSIHLQRAWNKYKEQNFDFVIVEEVVGNSQILLATEQKYLDIAKNEINKCYNMRFNASGGSLRKESIVRMSNSIKTRYKNDPSYKERATKGLHTSRARSKKSKSLIKTWKESPNLWNNARIAHRNYFSNEENLKKFSDQFKDKTIYTFENTKTGQKYIGTQYDFRKIYNLKKCSLNNLIKGRNKSYRFWILCS